MELSNPKLTIQNTDQPYWLVRIEQAFSDCEHMDVQLKVLRRQPMELGDLQAQLLRQLAKLVGDMQGNPP